MVLLKLNKTSVLKKPLDVNSELLIKISSEPIQSKIDYCSSKINVTNAIATTIK